MIQADKWQGKERVKPAIIYFQLKELSSALSTTIYYIIFAVSLIDHSYIFYFRNHVEESKLFIEGQKGPKTKQTSVPIKELFKSESGRNFLQIFVLMTGLWFTFNAIASALPEK